MLDIGTQYEEWDNEHISGTVTVMGYVFYDDVLYYTCIDYDGNEADIHHRDAEEAVEDAND